MVSKEKQIAFSVSRLENRTTKELLLETFLPQNGVIDSEGRKREAARPGPLTQKLESSSAFKVKSSSVHESCLLRSLQFSLLAVSPQSLQFVSMLNKQASVTGSSLSPLQCYLLFDNRWHTVRILLPSNTFAVDNTKHKVFGSFLRYTSLKFYLFIWGGMCMQRCMCGALRTIRRSHFCPFIMGSWVLNLGFQALAVGTFTYCATLPASSEIFLGCCF